MLTGIDKGELSYYTDGTINNTYVVWYLANGYRFQLTCKSNGYLNFDQYDANSTRTAILSVADNATIESDTVDGDKLYGTFASHGSVTFIKVGRLVWGRAAVYSSSALTRNNKHFVVADANIKYKIGVFLFGISIGNSDGQSGIVTTDGYNLQIQPVQGDITANTYQYLVFAYMLR